ncbi:hypothetical protein D043_1542A, partial [Vibrio parahaemolyticus EKP-021]
MRVQSRPH